MHKILIASALVLVLASPGLSAQAPVTPQPSATPQKPPALEKATPQNAAAFVGDWDLSGEGSNGPASFTLSIKPQGETLTAVLKNADDVAQTVNEVSMAGSALSLSVTFYNAGSEYPSVVALTPADDKILLHIEVANGLAQLDGTAKKKTQK
jgi:hypothetical protein